MLKNKQTKDFNSDRSEGIIPEKNERENAQKH